MRVYGIGDITSFKPTLVIPMSFCPPIIVGVYTGEGKPNRDVFLEPLLKELERLHPRRGSRDPRTGKLLRRCAVRVRSMICDAKERSFLKGCYVLLYFHSHVFFL